MEGMRQGGAIQKNRKLSRMFFFCVFLERNTTHTISARLHLPRKMPAPQLDQKMRAIF